MKRFAKTMTRIAPLVALALLLGLFLGASTAAAEDGQAIFEAQKCNLCHSVPAAGIEAKTKSEKMKGADLLTVTEGMDAEWLKQYLKKEVELNGEEHKRPFKGTDEELQTLVDWLLEQKIEG